MKQHNIVVLRKIILQIEPSYVSFESFLKKADHTDKQRLVKLWLHIDGCQGRYSDEQEDRKKAWISMFGRRMTYHKRRMQQLMSFLREQATQYIHQYLIEQTAEGQYLLFNLLERMGLDGSAHVPKNDQLSEWKYLRDLHFSGKGGKATDPDGALQKGLSLFTGAYNQDVLLAYVDVCSQHRIDQEEIPENVIREAQELMTTIAAAPINEVGCAAVRYFISPHKARYQLFNQLYFKHFEQLGVQQSFFLIILVNAVYAIPHRDTFFSHEYVRLYRFGFEHDLLRQNGKISAFRFNNIVFTAEFVSDYSFIDEMITTLGPCIADPKQRNMSLALANAYDCFGKGQYDKAIAHLSYLEQANDVPFHLIMKKHLLELKCLYDIQEYGNELYNTLKKEKNSYYAMLNEYLGLYFDEKVYESWDNFFKFFLRIADKSNLKNTKQELKAELTSFIGNVIQLKWLQKKVMATPIWNSIYKFKKGYDSTWHKYDFLAELESQEYAFKRKISRYQNSGYINEKTKQSCLNFFNILCRICDERNPRNSRRRLIVLLESYEGNIVEREWIEEKIKRIRK